ncbi:MAG: hypothetical protein GY679_00685 [Mycoplasma sp.]|nr:hypothetical protein [Mycoplasma sp.]
MEELKWFKKYSKPLTFTLASFLGLTTILSFAIFYMATKGFETFPKTAKVMKSVIHKTPNGPTAPQLSELWTIELPSISVDLKPKILQGLLILSIISLPLIIVQLSLGANKNIAISLAVNIITGIFACITFGLMITLFTSLTSVNSSYIYIKKSTKLLEQKYLDLAMTAKVKADDLKNNTITSFKII